MSAYKLIVYTGPVAGREDEYNHWYDNVHLADLLKVPGVVAAERLKLHTPVIGDTANRYLAIYEIEAEDPQAVVDTIMSRSASGEIPLTDALDMTGQSVAVFEALPRPNAS